MTTVDVSKDNIDTENKTGESDDAALNQPYFPGERDERNNIWQG